ncbi:hypothetical protein POM88_015671 [Heracleum sosnowskyi]|uniref:Uncharacterized protein n=1 Tax=Heracleum sosnowskyi TaxID=360622 RepID=A0AAD8IMM2_9APIA|nr:hypothetical protein POM88_015671 [Heracleum sosnowskyi]
MGMDKATYLGSVPHGPCLDNQDIWAGLEGPFGLRWCAPKSYTDVPFIFQFNVLDHISLIVRGEMTGDMRSIDVLATQGGCGGVNALKRRAIEMDDGHVDHVDEEGSVHLGDDVGAHMSDEVEISNAPHTSHSTDFSLQSNVRVGNTSVHIEDEAGARNVHFTPPSSHPTFQFLSPSDFQWPPRQEHLNQQEQPAVQDQPHHDEETGIVEQTPPLSYPTFQLLSYTDFQWPPHQEPVSQHEQLVDQQNSVQPQQSHQVEEQPQHLVQEPMQEQQEVDEEQPIMQPIMEQEQPIEEHDHQVDEEQPMHELALHHIWASPTHFLVLPRKMLP